MPKAVVVDDCVLRGDITIGTGCVIHPKACIIGMVEIVWTNLNIINLPVHTLPFSAEGGPITIGDNCIIEEYTTIINKRKGDAPIPMTIGANNIFEVGSSIESRSIGERNIFECKSRVSADVIVTTGCVIGAGCQLVGKQTLDENTVVYGKNCQQRSAFEKQGSHILQLDFLRKVLPNYHHLKNKKKIVA